MNEVEVPEGSVLTYRLSNGTHVLIHQSPTVQNKGTEDTEVDCEEGVPLLFLEGGQISYNGHELLQTQLLDQVSSGSNFLLPASPSEATNNKTDQASQDVEGSKTVLSQLVPFNPVILDGTTDQTRGDNFDKVLEEENVTLERLEEFVELVTSYKCRICPFTTPEQEELIQHFRSEHMQTNSDNTSKNMLPEQQESTPAEPIETDDTPVTSAQPISEKLIYLCGECSDGFGSLEACKQHMVQDHDMIVLDSPANPKSANEASTINGGTEDLFSSPTDPEETDNQETGTGGSASADKEQTGSDVNTKRKRKVRIPKMLEQEYLLAKETGNSDPAPSDDKLKCSERACQYKFNTEEGLQVHMDCHRAVTADGKSGGTATSRREFACSVCSQRFERWRGCALHLWKAHEIDAELLSCPVCQTYKTVTAVKLDNHIKIHGEARAYTCPECGKGFKQASQLRNHRVMHMDRKVGPVPKWYASKRCDICFKSYADSKCLKKHIQAVHSKLRPYVCQVCGHASARKAMLQMHLRQHTGEKPYNCTLCEYRTGDHNSLRRHIMRHTGQRPYHCPHCDYSAIQSNSYKNHLRSKHPGLQGLFSCTQCSFRTVSQEGFLQHVSDHKNGLISSTPSEGEIEVFPGNVAAAHLIYRCLNALSTDGNPLQANVTGSATSEDGTTQTITIQIPTQQQDGSEGAEGEDEATHCFLAIQEEEEEGVDTGGITIPADPDPDPSPGIVPGGS